MKVLSAVGKVKGTTRVSQLLILLSFLITFVISRLTVQIGSALRLQSPNVIKGVHVHHLVPGIFLILISGYIGISYWKSRRLRWLMAILFGAGAALTIDEFALWLHLKDVYWSREGRISVDTIILLAAVFLIAFTLSQRHDHKEVKRFWSRMFAGDRKI